jgi:CHAD domain-containing protein
MVIKLDRGYCVYGAGALAKRIIELRQEIDGVRSGKDIEYVHRMRVASRRLRAALPLFGECLSRKQFPVWEKQIKKITRALGTARDTDVQLFILNEYYRSIADEALKPGIKRLIFRLQQQRTKLQNKVIQALDDLQTSTTLDEMDHKLQSILNLADQTYLYTPYLYQKAYQVILERLNELLTFDEFVNQPDRIIELHAMRIAAKRLRYTMEIFAALYPGEFKKYISITKNVQEQLGEIHDCDVWSQVLPLFLQEERSRMLDYFGHARAFNRLVPGVRSFEVDRKQMRDQYYQNFTVYWGDLMEKNIWQDLRRILQIPPRFEITEALPGSDTQIQEETAI